VIEAHPVLHYLLILLSYNLGQFSVVLGTAYISSKSTLNSFGSVRNYFDARRVPIFIRWLTAMATFLVVWGNPSVLNLERFMPNFGAHLGVAWFIGVGWDQILDKILAIVLPGVQKELPAVPPAEQTKPE